MTRAAYLALIGTVALLRLAEIRLSNKNRAELTVKGAVQAAEPHFRWMVFLHAAVLISAALEVVLWNRPFVPGLAIVAGSFFVGASVLRWWVIRTMAKNWTVRVMASSASRVVTEGPFRWIRHPNYLAVYVEMIALPLIHTAFATAAVGALAHAWVLRKRIEIEEAALLENPEYGETMAHKPRFLPRLRRLQL